jgi:regulator of sigma D
MRNVYDSCEAKVTVGSNAFRNKLKWIFVDNEVQFIPNGILNHSEVMNRVIDEIEKLFSQQSESHAKIFNKVVNEYEERIKFNENEFPITRN